MTTLQSSGDDRVVGSFLNIEDCDSATMPLLSSFSPKPAAVAGQFMFENCAGSAAGPALKACDWPLMRLRNNGLKNGYTERSQILTIPGDGIRRLASNGRVVGACWSDPDADYCLLAGIQPGDLQASRPVQTRQVFESIEHVLNQAGMSFDHVVRTWLYLDGLLDWYDSFNAVRNDFFRGRGVFDGLVPASTGIGIANHAGAAILAGALAIRPKHAGVKITAVESPLQCSALNYRSSFSRAVEVALSDRRCLMISGTASIAPDGTSVHDGDVKAQIGLTMSVVEAILASRGMNWNSAVRAIAYFARREDVPLLGEYLREQRITTMPLTSVHADVCRGDLLFEIELDAVAGLEGERGAGRKRQK